MPSPKKSEKLDKLPPRKRRYVAARVNGASKKDAALEAGFSESMALKAGSKIETPDVKAAFQELVSKAIPESVMVLRLAEGLDAEKSTFTGNMIPDYKTRLDYWKVAGQVTGRFFPQDEGTRVTVPVQVNIDL